MDESFKRIRMYLKQKYKIEYHMALILIFKHWFSTKMGGGLNFRLLVNENHVNIVELSSF